MKNKLTDLNDALFAQLERLADSDLEAEQLESEIKRAQTMVSVADTIIDNAQLMLNGQKFIVEHGGQAKQLPMLAASTSEVKA